VRLCACLRMHMCLYVCLSVCLFVCLSVSLSVSHSVYLCVCVRLPLSIRVCVCVSVSVNIMCVCVRVCIHVCICMCVHLLSKRKLRGCHLMLLRMSECKRASICQTHDKLGSNQVRSNHSGLQQSNIYQWQVCKCHCNCTIPPTIPP